MYIRTAYRMVDGRGYEFQEPEVYHHVTFSSHESTYWWAPGLVARLSFGDGGKAELFSPTMDFGVDHLNLRGWYKSLVGVPPPPGAKTALVNSMQHWILKVNMTKEEIDTYVAYMKKTYPDWNRDWRIG